MNATVDPMSSYRSNNFIKKDPEPEMYPIGGQVIINHDDDQSRVANFNDEISNYNQRFNNIETNSIQVNHSDTNPQTNYLYHQNQTSYEASDSSVCGKTTNYELGSAGSSIQPMNQYVDYHNHGQGTIPNCNYNTGIIDIQYNQSSSVEPQNSNNFDIQISESKNITVQDSNQLHLYHGQQVRVKNFNDEQVNSNRNLQQQHDCNNNKHQYVLSSNSSHFDSSTYSTRQDNIHQINNQQPQGLSQTISQPMNTSWTTYEGNQSTSVIHQNYYNQVQVLTNQSGIGHSYHHDPPDVNWNSGNSVRVAACQEIDGCQASESELSTNTTNDSEDKEKRRGRRGRPKKIDVYSKGDKANGKLWEFIRDLLLNDRTNPSFIRWERREDGVFKFVQSDKVAKMWGERKQNPKMTYEKLSRAMRYYYKSKVLLPVFGRRLVYKFGPNATGWMDDSDSTTNCRINSVQVGVPNSQSISNIGFNQM